MNDTEFEKLGGLVNDCRLFNIPILPPKINESESKFSVSADGKSIVYGLGLVKNVGNSADLIVKERKEHGNYTSFADFMLRTKCRKDVAESLINAGAFDDFTNSRASLFFAVPDFCDCIKTINLKKAILADETKSQVSKENAKKAIDRLTSAIKEIEYDASEGEDISIRLKQEKEMTGAYISGHPLNSYPKPTELGVTPIGTLNEATRAVTVFGIIKNLRETNRKSDGAKMAFFELEDLSGTVKINCFTKAYANNKDYIEEDMVVKIFGEAKVDTDTFNSFGDDGEDAEEQIIVINASKITPVESIKPQIILYVDTLVDWVDLQDTLIGYWDNSGCELFVKDNLNNYVRSSGRKVSKEILQDRRFKTTLI